MTDNIVKFVRGSEVKFTHERFESELLEKGFILEGKEAVVIDEKEQLLEKAKALGLEPHHRAGVDKIKEMIAEAKGK